MGYKSYDIKYKVGKKKRKKKRKERQNKITLPLYPHIYNCVFFFFLMNKYILFKIKIYSPNYNSNNRKPMSLEFYLLTK